MEKNLQFRWTILTLSFNWVTTSLPRNDEAKDEIEEVRPDSTNLKRNKTISGDILNTTRPATHKYLES